MTLTDQRDILVCLSSIYRIVQLYVTSHMLIMSCNTCINKLNVLTFPLLA